MSKQVFFYLQFFFIFYPVLCYSCFLHFSQSHLCKKSFFCEVFFINVATVRTALQSLLQHQILEIPFNTRVECAQKTHTHQLDILQCTKNRTKPNLAAFISFQHIIIYTKKTIFHFSCFFSHSKISHFSISRIRMQSIIFQHYPMIIC